MEFLFLNKKNNKVIIEKLPLKYGTNYSKTRPNVIA